MLNQSSIEWTHSTWNPVTGCSKVSAGCDHCYAARMARRLQAMGVPKYRNGFEVTLHPEVLGEPLRRKKPQIIFVNSMSDLFHEKIPLNYVRRVFDVMRACPQHVFQVLTKRSKRLVRLQDKLDWPENVWMGVSVENEHYRYRINDLRKTKANVRFLSLEPLLGPVPDMNLTGINWAIVGGESGPGARPMLEEWVLDIQKQCRRHKTAFFFKQWGGINRKKTGRLLKGRSWDQMPDVPQLNGPQRTLSL